VSYKKAPIIWYEKITFFQFVLYYQIWKMELVLKYCFWNRCKHLFFKLIKIIVDMPEEITGRFAWTRFLVWSYSILLISTKTWLWEISEEKQYLLAECTKYEVRIIEQNIDFFWPLYWSFNVKGLGWHLLGSKMCLTFWICLIVFLHRNFEKLFCLSLESNRFKQSLNFKKLERWKGVSKFC
jgi:hypothetical protein